MEEDNQVIGPWKKIKVLGYGGFGQVTLWYKKQTEEYVAIKRPQESELKSWIKDKHMERWCKEIEIMKKLNHLNIVKALNIPAELESLSNVPMLAMEYCGLGDLRQVLNKPEHCCGLKEPTVIKILRDISSGLAYLHSCKVIHRDLKPDNIVLQCKESVVIYKLIDLGYAKELDQSSVCKSFVGTVQYLAPELFLGKLYNCSVDYWSFGILAHEIITGYRPFLPGSNPPEWMKQVQNKQRNIISVIENTKGAIIYSSSISKVNQMSRCLLPDIEKWLQLALDWDGEARGKDPQTKKLVFFDVLNEILDKVILKVFSLPTYEILSYEIKPETDVFSLKCWLERDTGIGAEEQILLLKSGKCLESTGMVMNFIKNEAIEPGSISLFLYNCGTLKIKSRVVLKPLYVMELLEDPKRALAYRHLKRSCSDSVFFLKSELELFSCLLEAINVKISNIRSRKHGVESLFEDVMAEWSQVENFAQFLIISHKADLENYINLRKQVKRTKNKQVKILYSLIFSDILRVNFRFYSERFANVTDAGIVSEIHRGELQSSEFVQKWIKNVMCVEKRVSDLMIPSNRKHGKLALEEAQQKCKSLENNEFVSSNDSSVLNGLLNEAHKIWENIQKIPKENRNTLKSNTETVKILYRCIEYTTKLLRSPLLDLLFLQFSVTEDHLTKLISPLTIWSKSCKIMRQIIENTQKERQKEVWNLVVKQKEQETEKRETKNEKESESKKREMAEGRENKDESNSLSPFHIPKTVRNYAASPVHEVFKPNFKIMEPVLVPHKSDLQLHRRNIQDNSLRSLESESIINTNNYLRTRAEEINQSWSTLLTEMKSLNWNSLQE